jgi:hypothetical protein
MTTAIARWRGLTALVADAVTHGASAIETVHLATARRPFAIIERAPGLAVPTKGVHAAHDLAVSSVYASVRVVTAIVAKAVDLGLEIAEEARTSEEPVEPREP